MPLSRTTRCLALSIALLCPPLWAVEAYAPQMGQPGKDVIWVPTPDALVEKMLTMANVTAQDYVVDLGSGDGRTVIAAAKRGATAVGIEYNADMVAVSRKNAEAAGLAARTTFLQADIFTTDFSRATVVTMYLLSSLNLRLRPTLLKMKPGTRLVSHAFTMAEWAPDETATIDGYSAYLWIVPAPVQGRWQASGPHGPFVLALDQKFQQVSGRAEMQGQEVPLMRTSLSGATLAFTLNDADGRPLHFRGTVNGEGIEGTVDLGSGSSARWSAKRTG